MKNTITLITGGLIVFVSGIYIGSQQKRPILTSIPANKLVRLDEQSSNFYSYAGPFYITWDDRMGTVACLFESGPPWATFKNRFYWQFDPFTGYPLPIKQLEDAHLNATP